MNIPIKNKNEVGLPPTGFINLFIDSTDNKLKAKTKDSKILRFYSDNITNFLSELRSVINSKGGNLTEDSELIEYIDSIRNLSSTGLTAEFSDSSLVMTGDVSFQDTTINVGE